jgi:hypothetical protein
MDWRLRTKRVGKGNWIKMILAAGIALILVKVFTPQETNPPDKPFSLKACLDSVPAKVDGLKVIKGSRSKKSIIKDMVPVVCRGEALFKRLQAEGEAIEPGAVTFQVTIEFNGEVIQAKIADTTIASKKFNTYVTRCITGIDFAPWQREDIDTVFIYPAYFGKR